MILVTGARGVVGTPLCEALSSANLSFYQTSRQENSQSIQWDLGVSSSDNASKAKSLEQSLKGVSTLIHCAPIWLLCDHLELLERVGVEQMIVFSSTSVLSKRNSNNAQEQHLVDQLQSAEAAICDFCQRTNIDLTILRPTLIYGYGRDQNVSHIAQFIQRYRLMFLVGKANGLRQPVHADDLVTAALNCLKKPIRSQVAYNLAGGDVISYRHMVELIFKGLKRKPIIVSIPLSLFRIALSVAAKLGRFSYTPEMADRMNQNLNYDNSAAISELGFEPQGFLEKPERDLAPQMSGKGRAK